MKELRISMVKKHPQYSANPHTAMNTLGKLMF